MLNPFKRKPKYTKRTDGKLWTRAELLRLFAKDLEYLNPVVRKNSITVSGNVPVTLEFFRKEYTEDNLMAFSATIAIDRPHISDSPTGWVLNLEDYRKLFPESPSEPISIQKDASWESSQLHRDAVETYGPLLEMFSDYNSCRDFLEGRGVNVGEIVVSRAKLFTVFQATTPLDCALDYFRKTYVSGDENQ